MEGLTPVLIAAAIPTATETLRYLLQKGAGSARDAAARQPRRRGDAGRGTGAFANLKLLLDAGADGRADRKVARRIESRTGRDPVRPGARRRGQRAGEGATALMAAATSGCDACVRLLIERGAEVIARTESGITALHNAAFEGNPATVKQLCGRRRGGQRHRRTGIRAADMMAVSSRTGNAEVPRLLLARGANAAAKDNMGRTVADWSRIGARAEILKLMHVAPGAVMVKSSVTEPAARDIRATVQKSVNLLQATAPNFFRSTGCISCHNVSIPMMALTEARRRGYSADPAPSQKMTKRARRAARSAPR